MTWHFIASLDRKLVSAMDGERYLLRAERHRLYLEDAQSYEGIPASITLHDYKSGLQIIQDHRWSEDAIPDKGSETAWILYDEEISSRIFVSIVLSEETLDKLRPDLHKMLHGSGAIMEISLRKVSFSKYEDNPYSKNPTEDSFHKGSPLFNGHDFAISVVTKGIAL